MRALANSVEFDEVTLKRVPYAFVFIIILLLGLPIVALMHGIDLGSISNNPAVEGVNKYLLESQIRGYFRQTILQWSAFSLSLVTVLLAFTQYKLAKDKIALVIGLSVLFSGMVQAMHTVIIDGINTAATNKDNLDALIWTFSNTVSGLIFIVGLFLLLMRKGKYKVKVSTFVLLSLLSVSLAFASIYYVAAMIDLPNMWFKESTFTRPYEVIYVLVYLFILIFIYPRAYRLYPSILTNCIFYMSVTQVIMGVYLMLVSTSPYDSGFYIGYFLKIVVYFIPFASLVINYVFSYQVVLNAQALLKENQEKFKHLAAHDVLTNLFNRREFEDLLEKTVFNFMRSKQEFALLLLDVDNFKTINDTLGHGYGDDFLKQFAIRLSNLTRRGDIVARIGGDEFAIISSKLRSASDPRHMAERIVEGLREPYPVGQKLLISTISIGIALFPEDGDNGNELLKNADTAMYSAKRSGRNTYRFYTKKLTQEQQREAEIEANLRDAIKNQEFELYYQPKYDLLTSEIVGAEALLRWDNPVLGKIPPVEFIPIAESSGLIIEIGEWVLREACHQVQQWHQHYQKELQVSVNVSAVQLESAGFLNLVKVVLDEFELAPHCLDLEITETFLTVNSEEAKHVLNRIDELGVNISIDDFGIGYSSLSRLKHLPIDTLKIDRAFIADIESEDQKVVLVDVIIKLAKELGMNIVAEGIETEAQLNYLIARHCHMGQGFLLGKPLTLAAFEALVFVKVF